MSHHVGPHIIAADVDLERFRFDWTELPAIAGDLPGTGGKTRVCLDDFIVSEIPRFYPDGEGEFAYAYVEKRGLNTHDLVAALRERGVPYNAVGVAGLKDKYAVTRQWLSVPVDHAGSLEALDELEGARVLGRSRHGERLRRGHLRGNRFEVRVRQPEAEWEGTRPRRHPPVGVGRTAQLLRPSAFRPLQQQRH